jgi:cation diffusion facilitator family transporter
VNWAIAARGERQEKKRAALLSVVSAAVLVSLKVFLALTTGSLGVLSEALHSGLDLIAAVITSLSIRVADEPADENHPYGHGKFENFSAFVETGLLLLTALYIIWEAFQRLLFHGVHLHPGLGALAILLVGLGIDLTRARALQRVARKYRSEALEADALHFSTDVWSTTVVIAGIAAVWAGERWGAPWMRYADPLAALVVAGFIIWVGGRLGRRTIDALVDTAPVGVQRRITAAVQGIDGVLRADRVRVRRAGNRHFVDVTISLARTASLEQAHALSDAVERRVAEIVPADVMVHMEPRAPTGEHLFEAIRAAAQRRGLEIHDLWAQQMDSRLLVDLHLEVDERLSLREAHRHANELEAEIRSLAELGAEVNIHIEPQGKRIPAMEGANREMELLSHAVQEFINGLPAEPRELVDCHDVRVREVEHRVVVSCHCAMDGSLPITRVHDVMASLEDRVKEKFPRVSRLTIHPEPVEER